MSGALRSWVTGNTALARAGAADTATKATKANKAGKANAASASAALSRPEGRRTGPFNGRFPEWIWRCRLDARYPGPKGVKGPRG